MKRNDSQFFAISMRKPALRWAGTAALRCLIWIALAFPASAARGVIGVGESAPTFVLAGPEGDAQVYDASTSAPLLLMVVTPEDKYTSPTLAAIAADLRRTPALDKGLRRWIVASRIPQGEELAHLKALLKAFPGWKLLLDSQDKVYGEYRIIATPTLLMIGGDRKVVAIHPGFDPGMEQDVQLALGKLMGVAPPEMATGTPAPPDMRLEMGRRLAARGIYDRAFPFYEQALKAGPLAPDAQLELADIYLWVAQLDKAQSLLDQAPKAGPLAIRAAALKERLKALREGKPDPAFTPKGRMPAASAAATPTPQVKAP